MPLFVPPVGNGVRTIRMPLGTAATQDSVDVIPANFYVNRVLLKVTTPYSVGSTIKVGQAGSLSLLMATTDLLPQTLGGYFVDLEDVAWGATDLVVRVTITGAPVAGAGVLWVEYSLPIT